MTTGIAVAVIAVGALMFGVLFAHPVAQRIAAIRRCLRIGCEA